MKKKIFVVAAVIEKDGKLLAMQRGGEGILNGKWEFPGGKVEPGESVQQTITREIKEELDIQIQANEVVGITEYEYPFAIINLTFVICNLIDDSKRIKLNVHKAMQWVGKDELHSLDWAEADIEILSKLK